MERPTVRGEHGMVLEEKLPALESWCDWAEREIEVMTASLLGRADRIKDLMRTVDDLQKENDRLRCI